VDFDEIVSFLSETEHLIYNDNADPGSQDGESILGRRSRSGAAYSSRAP